MMVTPEGIDVEVMVSTGNTQQVIPNVLNMDYRTAKPACSQLGFYVEIENSVSDSYTKD